MIGWDTAVVVVVWAVDDSIQTEYYAQILRKWCRFEFDSHIDDLYQH